jgi:hypothetical protein
MRMFSGISNRQSHQRLVVEEDDGEGMKWWQWIVAFAFLVLSLIEMFDDEKKPRYP